MKSFTIIAGLMLAALCAAAPARAETIGEALAKMKDLPTFEQYPAKTETFQKAASVDLSSHPDARTYRTRIKEGFAKSEAIFAGHYAIVSFGCGSSCQNNWIIDMATGKIADQFLSESLFEVRLDSRMILVNPMQDVADNDISDFPYIDIKYYEFKDGKLVLLKTITRSTMVTQ